MCNNVAAIDRWPMKYELSRKSFCKQRVLFMKFASYSLIILNYNRGLVVYPGANDRGRKRRFQNKSQILIQI